MLIRFENTIITNCVIIYRKVIDVEIILNVYVVVKTDFIPFLENDFQCHNIKTCFVLFCFLFSVFYSEQIIAEVDELLNYIKTIRDVAKEI